MTFTNKNPTQNKYVCRCIRTNKCNSVHFQIEQNLMVIIYLILFVGEIEAYK